MYAKPLGISSGYPLVSICEGSNCSTAKLVYKDHPGAQHSVVLIHRWSLYAGSVTWKIYPWEPLKCGLYKQVVFVYG